jgi:hypothetical protein
VSERGSVLPLALGLGLVLIAVSGLAVDGTRAFLLRRTLQNAADAAALAGAGEVDRSVYYRTGGEGVALHPDAARRTALAWLARRGISAGAGVRASPERVGVVLRGRTQTMFLRLVGIGSVPVAARARAGPRPGP